MLFPKDALIAFFPRYVHRVTLEKRSDHTDQDCENKGIVDDYSFHY